MIMSIKNQEKLHSSIIFKKKHSICHHNVKKSAQGEEANLESFLLSCYTLMNPNKSVQPIGVDKLYG